MFDTRPGFNEVRLFWHVVIPSWAMLSEIGRIVQANYKILICRFVGSDYSRERRITLVATLKKLKLAAKTKSELEFKALRRDFMNVLG